MTGVRGVRAILLDALGTLVGLEPPAPRLRLELARIGIEVSEEEAAAAIAAEIAYYRAHLDEGRDRASLAELRGRCAEALRAALPGKSAAAIGSDELTAVLLASLRFTEFADVRPALERWRGEGCRLVVVSNWDVSLHEVLGRLEIAPLLDGILTSAQAGVRKPAPEIFWKALAVAGARPGEAVHVGDSLEEDVAGARAAGIAPVLIARSGGTAPAGVRTIASLGELSGDAAAPGP